MPLSAAGSSRSTVFLFAPFHEFFLATWVVLNSDSLLCFDFDSFSGTTWLFHLWSLVWTQLWGWFCNLDSNWLLMFGGRFLVPQSILDQLARGPFLHPDMMEVLHEQNNKEVALQWISSRINLSHNATS
jgi:hypothetical protein